MTSFTSKINPPLTVSIVGVGLMGASLALALRESKNAARYGKLIGVARREDTVREALHRKIVDEATTDFARGVAEADIIVLATPVRTSIEQIHVLANVARTGAMVTDLGSTKGDVIAAMDQLPERLRAVGSHPMCGKETSGMDVAEANLYVGRPWILTRTRRSDESSFTTIKQLAEDVGAVTLEIEAARHDAVLAMASHLPYAVALALMTTADAASQNEELIYRVMAGGFRDTSRVAASDVTMWTDILLTNKSAALGAMRDFQFNLDQLIALIERDDETGLRSYLGAAADARKSKVKVRS
jgi:prephenate dehydrogenase